MKRSGLCRRVPLRRRTPSKSSVRYDAMDTVRRDLRLRSGGRCEVGVEGCRGTGVHAHHRKMRSQGGEDTTANCLWVCASCHRWVHEHPAQSYAHGWLVRSWQRVGDPR